jgi:hypothetical protein
MGQPSYQTLVSGRFRWTPDGRDLEQLNKPVTECLLLDTQEQSERS